MSTKLQVPADEQWEHLYNKASAERDTLRRERDELLAAAKLALPILAREYPINGSPTYVAMLQAITATQHAESTGQVSA